MEEDKDISSVVEESVKYLVVHLIKEQGFSSATSHALSLLSNTVVRYLVYISSVLKAQCEASHRTSPTLVDAVVVFKKVKEIVENRGRIELEEQSFSLPAEYVSEICTYVEPAPNYYEFLPKFPPVHTFKNTPIKRRVSDDRAQKARLRNEQTIKIVDSLFSIMKRSKKNLRYANYLM
ncbi:hypothetical protein NECID01_1646 [Nematocida sp. AWRm77]|nr:hypothetical protein NECID01_1646 [Nematocida sp. AWRm77]